MYKAIITVVGIDRVGNITAVTIYLLGHKVTCRTGWISTSHSTI